MTLDDATKEYRTTEQTIELRSQLLVLDFVHRANRDERLVRKSDVVKARLCAAQVTTLALSACINAGMLKVTKVSITPGRPSEYLALTESGTRTLARSHADLEHAKELSRLGQRKTRPTGPRKPRVSKSEVTPAEVPPSVMPYGAKFVESNALGSDDWSQHMYCESDYGWQHFKQTPELDALWQSIAFEIASYCATRYGAVYTNASEMLKDSAPKAWDGLYTSADVGCMLTYACMTGMMRSRFIDTRVEGLRLWEIVAEPDVLDYAATLGPRKQALATYFPEWAQ